MAGFLITYSPNDRGLQYPQLGKDGDTGPPQAIMARHPVRSLGVITLI